MTNSDKIAFTDAQLEHTVEREGKLYYKPFVMVDLKDGRSLTLNCKTYEQAVSVAQAIGSYRHESDIILSDIVDYFDPEIEHPEEETEQEGEAEVSYLKWYDKLILKIFSKLTKKQV